MKKILVLVAAALLTLLALAQTPDTSADANAKKARAALDAMVKAPGGQQWPILQNTYIEGRTSGFYQG